MALRASRLRIFLTVTLPRVPLRASSAPAFVVFTLAITDFGAPKVIGGDFNVLATDVYKQVIGQQNFEMGAVGERGAPDSRRCSRSPSTAWLQRRQVALLSSRAGGAGGRKPNRTFDAAMLAFLRPG